MNSTFDLVFSFVEQRIHRPVERVRGFLLLVRKLHVLVDQSLKRSERLVQRGREAPADFEPVCAPAVRVESDEAVFVLLLSLLLLRGDYPHREFQILHQKFLAAFLVYVDVEVFRVFAFRERLEVQRLRDLEDDFGLFSVHQLVLADFEAASDSRDLRQLVLVFFAIYTRCALRFLHLA